MKSHFSKPPRRPRRDLDAHLDTRYETNTVTYWKFDALDVKNTHILEQYDNLFLYT